MILVLTTTCEIETFNKFHNNEISVEELIKTLKTIDIDENIELFYAEESIHE